jgi:para-nitrobenzyl esterase
MMVPIVDGRIAIDPCDRPRAVLGAGVRSILCSGAHMTSVRTIIVALATLGAPPLAHAQTVAVTGGLIQGAVLDNGGAVFKGIPYAAPPVGELRWREPAPVHPWQGVHDATTFGAICAQISGVIVLRHATDTSNEDCLYLNVWTPEWPSESRRPVMVWMPGGGNFGGASSEDVYDGESLARHGVVLVTINYRLGTFGFFSHPALTRESPHQASGNQGILDQIAALTWVRANIATFGGDPDNVTIFGGSAGSLDVSVLMTSPLSKGLFQRAIGHSGPVIFADNLIGKPNTLAQAEKRGEMLVSRWHVPPDASAADLRKLSTAEILDAEPNYFKTDASYKITTVVERFPYLGVIVDGYVVATNPAEIFAAGAEHPVPLLLGSNARERIPGSGPPTDFNAALADVFGPLSGRAQTLYVGERDPIYGTPTDQWATDVSFRCGSVAQLAWHSAAGHPSYQFELARVPPGREAPGLGHGSELNYVFGTLDRAFVGPPLPVQPTAVDRQVSESMQQYWTNFAKTGNPNGGQLPAWPTFDAPSRAYMQFTDAGPVAKKNVRRPYCDLFIEHVKRQLAK